MEIIQRCIKSYFEKQSSEIFVLFYGNVTGVYPFASLRTCYFMFVYKVISDQSAQLLLVTSRVHTLWCFVESPIQVE